MLVRQPLEHRQIFVVVGVGGVVNWADHLQGVNDDQYGVWVSGKECVHLFLQPLTDEGALRAEVDAVWCVLCDLKQPVLDAEDRILQAEIEGGTLLGGHVPDRFSLSHRHRQPQSQPGLTHFRGACQDVQTLRDQGIHHKIGRFQRTIHQGSAVNCDQGMVYFVVHVWYLHFKNLNTTPTSKEVGVVFILILKWFMVEWSKRR